MSQLSKRQLAILKIIQTKGFASNKDIISQLEDLSRATIARDLSFLEKSKHIIREGKGRGVRYREYLSHPSLRFIDPDEYFKKAPDERAPIRETFDSTLIKNIFPVLNNDELQTLAQQTSVYREHVARLPPDILEKEIERLTIDFSWKSSRIEGNTYSLLDTELLLKEHQEAEGHTREEAIMILNHKKALEYVWSQKRKYKTISRSDIESIHDFIVKDLSITKGLRKHPVGIVGTRYRPPDNEYQIREYLEETCYHINAISEPFSKALLATVYISYLQPFADGNKRTARLLGDAILLAYDACPLSFRSVNESDYKKALILFYEQHSIRFFKDLFIEQYRFATENYFLV